MNQQVITIEKGTFKSVLIPIVAVLFAAAAVCGALSIITLFDPASIPAILHDMELSQIYDTTAQKTWLAVYIITTAVNFIGTLVLSLGLSAVLFGQHHKGMNLLFYSAKVALPLVTVSGVAALIYFIFRAVMYTVGIMSYGIANAMVPLYSMILSEGLMLALSWFAFVKLRRFLNCSMDAAASIGYTLATDKLKAPSIPGFSASGFFVLGLFDLGIALDRLFTFVHIQKNLSVTYKFPLTTDLVQILSGSSFAFAALGSFLLFVYLRGYKNKCERLLIRSF